MCLGGNILCLHVLHEIIEKQLSYIHRFDEGESEGRVMRMTVSKS